MKKSFYLGLSLLVGSSTAFAANCPNLSGTYLTEVQGQSTKTSKIEQVGCEKMVITITSPTNVETQIILLDGIFRRASSESQGYLMSAKFIEGAIQFSTINAYPEYSPGSSQYRIKMDSALGTISIDPATGDLLSSATEFDEDGKPGKVQNLRSRKIQ